MRFILVYDFPAKKKYLTFLRIKILFLTPVGPFQLILAPLFFLSTEVFLNESRLSLKCMLQLCRRTSLLQNFYYDLLKSKIP